MTAKHRRPTRNTDAYKWLGTGAITLGIGAATLAGGAGIAAAKTGDSTGTNGASSTHSAPDHQKPAAAGAPKKTHDTAKTPKAHSTAATAADTAGSPATKPAPSPKTKQPKPTAAVSSTTTPPATAPTSPPTVVVHPTTPAAAAAVAALKSVAATTTTAKATTATATSATNPFTTLANDIQKALLGFQSMFFSAPPKATATPAAAAATPAAASTNPLISLQTGIQNWIHETFFNTAPTVTVGTPTKNADGSYTGQITTNDADGDPLKITFDSNYGGTTTLQSTGNNTYTYTYTPSSSALSTPGYSQNLYFTVTETNADSHFHGPAQIQNAIVEATVGTVLRALGFNYPPYSAASWGSASGWVDVAVGPPVNPSGSAAAVPLAATINPAASMTTTPKSAASTNPLTNLQNWIHETFFNTAPTVTVGTPTKNADGSYTGQVTTYDADGDPLKITFNPNAGGTTTLQDDGNNTYTYTYTPSSSALSTPGYSQNIYFTVTETNADSHFHGPAQIQNAIVEATVGTVLRALGFNYPPYSAASWGTATGYVDVAVGPPVNPSGSAAAVPLATTVNPAASTTTVPKIAAAATNPLTTLIDNIQAALTSFEKNIQSTYFNTPPKFTTVTTPTKNADGTYSGQATATDADGDPLVYSVSHPYDGSTVTIDQNGNYTVTPSTYAVTTGTQDGFTVTVVEANASAHYHGISQIVAMVVQTFLHNIFGQLGYPPYYAPGYGTTQVYIPSFSLSTSTATMTT
ncbi:hypothetical protein ABIA30_003927 [Mycobacterium sp. MAA66]|uniref:Ig-like domain-containing protein n=1 Tax=Mycobacterium sp. MAA66 TaxID=3156297 RepID=UPI003517E6BF